MGKSVTVSIICAAYNAEKYIKQTIESILVQTINNWELIIVDDCSTDNTRTIVEEYVKRYANIFLVENEINSGPGITRNKGIAIAKGRYIAICDSDDIWLPQKLERQVEFMKRYDAPISYTSYELINSDGIPLSQVIKVFPKPMTYRDYLKNTIIGFSTSIIDRRLCSDITFADMRSREDTFLWCTLLKQGHKAYGLNEVLVQYRVHDSSVSADKIKASKQVWELYRDKLHISFLKRVYYFSCYACNAILKRYF